MARAIEAERALGRGSARAAMEVADAGALGRHAADALASRLGSLGGALAPTTQRRALRRGGIAVAGGAVALLLLGAARSAAPDGWRAVRHPIGAWRGTILPPLVIEGASRAILRGDKLRVRVHAPDRVALSLHVRATGAPWRTLSLAVHGGEAATVLGPLDADLALVATDGRVTSDTLIVHVTDRPFVGDVAIRALYPSYLGRTPETLPVGEPARVPRGTVLSISGRASTTLDGIALAGERDTIRLRADGHDFAGRLVARENGTSRWIWMARSELGPIADVPQPVEVDVVPDSAPRVDILAPAHDTVVLADATVPMRITASDDHGLEDVVLRTTRRLATGRMMPEVSQDLASPHTPDWSGSQPLELSPRALEPGDELHVVAEATDNSPWRQTASSRELVLRVPTLTEQRERARALADSTASQVSAAARSERDLAQRTGEAARSRADRSPPNGTSPTGTAGSRDAAPRSMSYQSAEQAKALAREQQELQDKVRQAQQSASALEQQLKAAGVMDSALTRQLRDAQQMLRDALTPELQQQLDEVMKATQQLSPDQARRAMQNLAQAQQKLREQLERSAEMLKRAALEGAMQTLHDEARDIAQNEHALSDSVSRGSRQADSSAARDANALSQRSRDLSKQVAALQQRLQQDQAKSGPQQLSGAPERADSSASSVRRAAPQQGPQPRPQGDQSRGERSSAATQAAQQMDQVQQQLAQARQQQIQEWKQQVTSELDRSIQETMQLAREQQQLADRARSAKTDDLRADQSAVQQGVQRVQQRVEQAARQSAHVSPQSQSALSDASQRVQEATRSASTSGRPSPETADNMDEAAEALNRAAAQMVQDRARAANGQSASGFAEMIDAMRDAAKQQGSVNAQSMGIMPVPGGQPSAQMLAQARALAARQRQSASSFENAGGGDARGAELAKEMRDIADALDRGRLDPSLIDRQQRLFHKLLDAGLTLQKDEREDNGKREAETARIDTAITSGTQSSGRTVQKYREPTWNELRGLTPDERRAVIEYFKRINADQP